jgi:hypothetical protein
MHGRKLEIKYLLEEKEKKIMDLSHAYLSSHSINKYFSNKWVLGGIEFDIICIILQVTAWIRYSKFVALTSHLLL